MDSKRPGIGIRTRQALYFGYHRARGGALGAVYHRFLAEDRARVAADGTLDRLSAILGHAGQSVPYYQEWLSGRATLIEEDPIAALAELPVLTKSTIRQASDQLLSKDLAARRTLAETSGGSTGEPVRLIQDVAYKDHTGAVQLLYSVWAGRQLGESEVMIWGSEEEILSGRLGLRTRLAHQLMARRYVNAFRMSQESMRECLADLSRKPPKLIVAYMQSIDDLATLAEREGIEVTPQQAIISTAGTLQTHMRGRIEQVFGCKVFDRYGSREVGDIAGECAHHRGMHVFPWTNFIEIVDEQDRPVKPGKSGRILVTSLCNFAMPLLRYEIGDRAATLPADAEPCPCGRVGQRIARVLGRTVDTFRAADGTLVNGEYFTHLLYFRDFVERFQVVQRSTSRVVYRLITSRRAPEEELAEIVNGTRAALGSDCEVEFEFVSEIAPSPSGKYRYTISEC